MNLFEMKQAREAALAKAETLINASEQAKRALTPAESEQCDAAMAEVNALNPQIEQRERLNTMRSAFPAGRVIPSNPGSQNTDSDRPAWQTREYRKAVAAFLASRGRNQSDLLHLGMDEGGGFKFPGLSAASYETAANSGVSVFPSIVEPTIIPLAPPVIGIESICTVMPTSMDLKFPRKKAHGTAAIKAEGTGSGTNLFTGVTPQTEQFTLSAFMVGHNEDASWELLQDVNTFQSFLTEDILLSLAVLKDALFCTGTGTGQPQGLKGNVGAGVTGLAVGTDNYASSIFDALYTVQPTLNPVYDNSNTTWLMQKATGLVIRLAQRKANLFDQVWTRENGKDFLHGNPVVYSASMDAIGAAKTPIFYGDFKSGYLIGYRGGAGVNVKILDQPKALEGLLTILGYQRVDGRVRRSEAIQGISLT